MLDEDEYARVAALLSAAVQATEEFRLAHGLSLESLSMAERFAPALEEYRRLTGFAETNPNAVAHHRVALYGPPCRACGKPLRTPVARRCGACGAVAPGEPPAA